MKKYQNILLGVFACAAGFTALYFSALIVLPNIVDLNKYKDEAAAAIEAQSGFKVSCENIELKRSLTPYLKIYMYHTLVLYPDNEVFLKLKESELRVKLLPLIFKKIVIKDAKLTRPIVNVTINEDFSTSVEKYFDASKNIAANGFIINTVIKDTLLERYKLKINDKTIGKLFYLEGDELLFKDVRLNDKMHMILKGALFDNDREYLKYDLDITSFLAPKAKFTFSPFKTIYESEIKGNVSGKLLVDKKSNFNGFLNADNISIKVDGVILSENSINLLFKGQEAEIKSVLHTSKTDTATVEGKYSYGRKKKLDMNVKAKHVNLSNLYKIASACAQALNISNELKNLKLYGLIDADFSLSSDFKKLKSTGSAKVINAEIKHNSLPYKITDINSNINFDNNKIVINNAQAYINKTPVNITGTINEDVSLDLKAASENLDLKNIVSLFNLKLPFNINKGMISFNSDIKGILNKSLNADSIVKISGLDIKDKTYNMPLNIKTLDMNLNTDGKKYSGDILCSDVKSLFENNPITAETFKINFNDKKITIPKNTLKIISSPLIIYGVITEPEINLSFDGDILASDIGLMLKKYINQPYKAKGKIQTSGYIFIKNKLPNLKIKMQAGENNYLSYAVIKELMNKPSILNIDCDIKEKEIHINDLSLSENSPSPLKVISVNGGIKSGKEVVFENLKINIPKTMTFATNFFGGEEVSLNADIMLNNTISSPKIVGFAKVLTYNIKKYLTAIKDAELSFADDNIRIIAPNVQINNSKLNLLADIDTKIREKVSVANLQLYSSNLDVNSFFDLIKKESDPFAKSVISVKKGTAVINNFSVLDLKASDISADFTLDNNILKIKNISANAYNGEVSGAINYDLPHSALDIMLEGKNINLKNSLYDLCKLDDNIAGTADFSSNISLITGTYNNVINSLTGSVNFNSINGKMGTLGKFEYYLYAQNILYHGLLNTTLNRVAEIFNKNNTAQYRNAKGEILFQNGYMIVDNIKTIGPDMSLYLKGRQNLISNQANLDIYGRISDEITGKLGSFGDVSISDLIDSKNSKSSDNVMVVPKHLIDEIPLLYNRETAKTNTFKVNILGDVNSVSAINSFMWIIPDEDKTQLPDFSDMIQNL